MDRKLIGFGICLVALAASATAQTVTGSGTTNTVPVFTGSATIGNSPISVSAGNVGIGTTSPISNLTISPPTGAATLDLAPQSTASSGYSTVEAGATGQEARESFHVPSASTGHRWWRIGAAGYYSCASGFCIDLLNDTGDSITSTPFQIGPTSMLLMQNGGSVGIGTTSPAYTLDVTGTIRTTTGIVFPDGTTQNTAFAPALCSSTGADYAESVGVSGDHTRYGPGDLLVIDPDHPGQFLMASQPYSTMVAGIYSTKPGFVGRKQPAGDPASANEIPMAMVGRVPTKVSAENGPIGVGDLLVTSSTAGYAMKGTDRSRMLGAVVGKALGSLNSGTGVIEVLVTLQ